MQAVVSTLDSMMDRVLFVRPHISEKTETQTQTAENAFSFSLMFSGIRCILQYAVFPFIFPFIGIAADAATPILMVINVMAMVSIVFSLRRFWRIRYDFRWVYLLVAMVTLFVLGTFLLMDIAAIRG